MIDLIDLLIDLIHRLPPGVILIVGALLLPLLRGRWQQVCLLLLPLLSAMHLFYQWRVALGLPPEVNGVLLELELFDYVLLPIRINQLSLVWGCIFHIALL